MIMGVDTPTHGRLTIGRLDDAGHFRDADE
jgi:hypothetical protein